MPRKPPSETAAQAAIRMSLKLLIAQIRVAPKTIRGQAIDECYRALELFAEEEAQKVTQAMLREHASHPD